MIFYNSEHKDFYYEKSSLAPITDVYRQSMFYLLGLMEETRKHFDEIYNSTDNSITPEVINKEWQTSGTLAIIRLAFNLYNGYSGNNEKESNDTPQKYAVDNIFYHKSFAPYFYEAIKIRFEITDTLPVTENAETSVKQTNKLSQFF